MAFESSGKGKTKNYYVTVTVGYDEVVNEMFLTNDEANEFVKQMKLDYPTGYVLKETR